MAFDPVLIGFSHLLFSETLYLALLLPGVLLLLQNWDAKRPTRWAAAGIIFGLATLTRPQLASFAPLLVIWAVWQARGIRTAWVGSIALLIAGMAIVVLPWSARNFAASGSFYLVDTNAPFNLAVGAEPSARFVDKDDNWNHGWAVIGNMPYFEVVNRDPGMAQLVILRSWREHVSADPLGFAAKSLWEASHLFTLDNFIGRHLRNGWYGPGAPKWLTGVYALVAAIFSALLLAGAGISLVGQPTSPFRSFTVLMLAHAVVIFGLAYSLSRYSVPLRPFLAVAAAWLVTCRPGEVARRILGNPARAVAAGLIAIFLLSSWSRDLPLLSDMVVDHGIHYRFNKGQ